MPVYNKSGAEISSIFEIGGSQITQAFDVDGDPLIEEPPLQSGLVIMTYNVQYFSGLNANTTMQEDILSTYNADIIGLQELGSGAMPAVGAEVLADYPHIYLGIQTNKTGIASKVPLSNISASTFSNQGGETRGYQKAYLTHNGKSICWINAHLATSTNEAAKVAQAGELFDMVQGEEYFIITGDFNTGGGYTTAAPEYATIMKQFIDAGYHSANYSDQHGFFKTWINGKTAESSGAATDQIITSANITIDTVILDTIKISYADGTQNIDHIPLIAEVTIS